MNYTIKDIPTLRKLLWFDTFLGSTTAILGLCFLNQLSKLFGLTTSFIRIVSIITLCYAIVAGILANQKTISIPLLRILIIANWLWAFISIVLSFVHFNDAQPLGKIFLLLQIIVVGGLAYFEGKQVVGAANRR